MAAAALAPEVSAKEQINRELNAINAAPTRNTVYNSQTLQSLRSEGMSVGLSRDILQLLGSLGLLCSRSAHTPAETRHSTACIRRRRSRRERKQKRGKRGGARAKLKANPHRAPLPSILLANVRSLEHKLDHLRAELTSRQEIKDCCALIFTESWLTANVPDSAIAFEGL